ncbi:MAG: Chorismate synthase [Deltaproteobacteria bacterium]|nr:Chorismate synthase [Deltaproteobacteria bacterium]
MPFFHSSRRGKEIAGFLFRTAGETHGPALVTVVEGLPAGLPVRAEDIDRELLRRQAGYGRGDRMLIEKDQVEILSGVRFGKTLGGPVAMMLRNLDWPNWREKMAQDGDGEGIEPLDTARPGHADLAGALKYDHRDVRNVLERASARETASRVMAGALAKRLLRELGATVVGQVLSIGTFRVPGSLGGNPEAAERAEASPLRMADPATEADVARWIDSLKDAGTTAGGVVEVIVSGLPPGLGSCVAWDRRLDGRLAQALMSIHAIKGVEVGEGFLLSSLPGSRAHDEVFPGPSRRNLLLGKRALPFRRETNRAGGLEGGMTNGEPLVVRAAMKPIPTQSTPLRTVTVGNWMPAEAHRERSDVCAVPAASVVAEAMVAIVLADAFLEKFGGDAMRDILYNYSNYLERICGK